MEFEIKMQKTKRETIIELFKEEMKATHGENSAVMNPFGSYLCIDCVRRILDKLECHEVSEMIEFMDD